LDFIQKTGIGILDMLAGWVLGVNKTPNLIYFHPGQRRSMLPKNKMGY
jgi:hypothetical protein